MFWRVEGKLLGFDDFFTYTILPEERVGGVPS
jgi:hypothetical protein